MLTFKQAIEEMRVGVAPPVDRGKASKASVDYTDESSSATDRCALCEHYDAGGCNLVAGVIDPRGWCELFEAERRWDEQPCTRVEMAMTGDPLVDAVLNSPHTKRNINNPVIDRSQPTPYGAGGSV